METDELKQRLEAMEFAVAFLLAKLESRDMEKLKALNKRSDLQSASVLNALIEKSKGTEARIAELPIDGTCLGIPGIN